MPNSLKSFAEFDLLLTSARAELEKMSVADPNDGAIASVSRQLATLHAWTRDGRCPAQDEKDQLNFGQIASRELDSYAVAKSLYALSSFVIWWGEKKPYE